MKSILYSLVLMSLLSVSTAWAINPSLSTVQPRGGQRGTDIEVTFQGGKLADAVDVFFHDPGITLKEIKEVKAGAVKCVLTIAPDCRVGPHRMRVRTKTGMTTLVLFSVGNLTEVKEVEPNNDVSKPQVISVNSTVNGVVNNEDADYYAVELEANTRLAVEVEALRLGRSLFDSKVRLFDPAGRQLIAEDDTAMMQQDAAFVFTTKEKGTHYVVLSESTYGGNGSYDYRMHIGNFPRPLAVTPMGVQQGQTTEVTWLGDPGIQKQSVAFPVVYPGTHMVLPANDLGVSPTEVPFRVVDYPGVVEVEPNNDVEKATAGTVPGSFDGVIQEMGDIDRFSFEGKKGQVFGARVWAREMGSPLDSVLTIRAPSGKAVVSNDDAAGLDSSQRITLPEDGKYTIEVRDHLKRGGAAFAYRLELAPVVPKLKVQVMHNEPAVAVIPQGNRSVIYLNATRNDFGGEIDLELLNLPAGITATHGKIPNGQTVIPVLLTAAADAPLAQAKMEVKCTSKKGETVVTGGYKHDYPVVLGRNKVVIMDTEINGVAMAVTEKAPYSVDFVVPKTPGIRGANKGIKVVVKRDEGFKAPITVRVPQYPSGLNGGTLTIPEGKNEGVFNVEIRANAPVGETKLIAIASSSGYTVATQLMPLNISEPWLTFAMDELRIEQGSEIKVPVKITHNKEYPGDYELQLYRLPKGVTSAKQPIKHGTAEVVFPLTVAADAPPGKHGNLGLTVVLMVDGEAVNHRAVGGKISLFKPLPPPKKKKEAPKPKAAEVKKDEPPKPKRRTRFPETAQ